MSSQKGQKSTAIEGTVVEWGANESLGLTDMDPPWGILEFVSDNYRPSGKFPDESDGVYLVKKGDFLRIFNDASRKNVLWEGRFEGIYGDYGVQKDENPSFWENMVEKKRPATLIRGGEKKKKPRSQKTKTQTQQVQLPAPETEEVTMEGVLVRRIDLQDAYRPVFFLRGFQDTRHMDVEGRDRSPYEGLHNVENGDLLSIFNDKSKKDLLWKGVVDMPDRQTQKGFSEKTWKSFFDAEKPAVITKRIRKK